VPIIVAGGIWWLSEWMEFMDNPEIGPVAFQFGTRPMVTIESPLHIGVKKKLMSLGEGGVKLQKFSPTGFYSSAVENRLLRSLEDNLGRQIPFSDEIDAARGFDVPVELARSGRTVYISGVDMPAMEKFVSGGFPVAMKTPARTLLFVSQGRYDAILADMKGCSGCLSGCMFSGWSQRPELKITPDPRSFCIQKSLQEMIHGGDPENTLLFSGQIVHRFKTDPFYKDGTFIPTVAQLFDRIRTGY
jgi:nitronate monooxygenase